MQGFRLGSSSRVYRLEDKRQRKRQQQEDEASDEDSSRATKRSRPEPTEVQCCHLLVKHNGSRNPKSWRQADPVTRSKADALELLTGYRAKLQTVLDQQGDEAMTAVFDD